MTYCGVQFPQLVQQPLIEGGHLERGKVYFHQIFITRGAQLNVRIFATNLNAPQNGSSFYFTLSRNPVWPWCRFFQIGLTNNKTRSNEWISPSHCKQTHLWQELQAAVGTAECLPHPISPESSSSSSSSYHSNHCHHNYCIVKTWFTSFEGALGPLGQLLKSCFITINIIIIISCQTDLVKIFWGCICPGISVSQLFKRCFIIIINIIIISSSSLDKPTWSRSFEGAFVPASV